MSTARKEPLSWLPWVVAAVFAAWIIGSMVPPREKEGYHLQAFSELPALLNGRIQPLDSVARNTLLMLRGKQSIALEDDKGKSAGSLEAIEWMLELMTKPDQADARKVFRIDHPEVKGLLGASDEEKHFSFNQIKDHWEKIQEQSEQISKKEAETRTPFEKGLLKLNSSLATYFRLKNSLRPERSENFVEELSIYKKSIPAGIEALQKQQAKETYSEEDAQMLVQFFRRYEMLSKAAYPMVVPPADPAGAPDQWHNIGASLMQSMRSGEFEPAVDYYARMTTSYTKGDVIGFNSALSEYHDWLAPRYLKAVSKGHRESIFNHYRPFVKSMSIYVLAFILACGYWVNWAKWMNLTAYRLVMLAMVVHTSGLIFRMVLEGRPPVTNLYSSAIFVGWGSVILGLVLERIYKDGIGNVVASAMGFTTLVIAHNLSLDGDTMEMMRAVLDTNFWLATHVVVVTLGYASTFLAGFLGIVYILRGFFTRTMSAETGKALNRMAYGIVCFATLFSFVGTVLGGIWADQSWGRFWGWDPKENGALIIVIWNALILHARWGGLVRERGLMNLVVFGNIVTSWSWFGVNMLGVGLHAYGFMDQAFKWLMFFVISQLVIIGIGLLPARMWKNFKGDGGGSSSGGSKPTQEPVPKDAVLEAIPRKAQA